MYFVFIHEDVHVHVNVDVDVNALSKCMRGM